MHCSPPRWHRVRLVPLQVDRDLTAIAAQVATSFAGAQSIVSITLEPARLLQETDEPFTWDALTDLLHAIPHDDDEFLFGLLDEQIEANWFGRMDPDRGVAFTTAYAWNVLTHIPVQAFFLFQTAAYLLRSSLPSLKLHEHTRGCIQDLCAEKTDFAFKLRTADICPECLAQARAAVPSSLLAAIVSVLEEARRIALGRSPKVADAPVAPTSLAELIDQEFPFPIAWAHRALQLETRPNARWFKLLTLCDTIFRYVIGVGMCLAEDIPREAVPSSIRSQLPKLSRATLGTREALAFELLRWLPSLGAQSKLPAMTAVMIPPAAHGRGPLEKLGPKLQQLVNDRNDTVGHGAAAGGDAECLRHAGTVTALLEVMRPWKEFPIVRPVSTGSVRGGSAEYVEALMMGSHSLFRQRVFSANTLLDSDVSLRDPDGTTYLNLYPWIVWQACDHCQHETLWLYERHSKTKLALQECGGVHKIEVPAPSLPPAFTSLFT